MKDTPDKSGIQVYKCYVWNNKDPQKIYPRSGEAIQGRG
jgi:hypothetical protein